MIRICNMRYVIIIIIIVWGSEVWKLGYLSLTGYSNISSFCTDCSSLPIYNFGPCPRTGKRNQNFDAQGCSDRASARMQWCKSEYFAKMHINQSFFLHNTGQYCATLAIKQLPYSPTSKNSREIDYFEAVFLLKQWQKHSSSFVMNF